MKRKFFAVLAAVCLMAASFVITSAIFAEQEVADNFIIQSSLFEKRTKANIEFTHKKHSEEHKVACVECHHVYKDGKNVWKEGDEVQKCQECHDVIKKTKECTEEEKKKHLKLAIHNNCFKGCHKKLKKENPESKAPAKCLECHPKKKK